MKISMLYNQGSAKVAEDGLIFQPPRYFGVLDGVSGVYLPSEGPRNFCHRTGGQLASSVITGSFARHDSCGLKTMLGEANIGMRDLMNSSNISLLDSAFLPGACFAVCEVSDKDVEIIKGGDCVVAWEMKDGSVGSLSNNNYDYEEYLVESIVVLMKKHNGDRQKMWEEFRPILIRKRQQCVNTSEGKVCLLNGQTQFFRYWQELILNRLGLKTLVLATDGLVPFEFTKNTNELAHYIFSNYHVGGLQNILELTRLHACRKEKTHEDFPEATAIALEF